ncbi:MAG: hypothetical protein R2856_17435 [Caldilineaceae bacterium]
MKITKIESLTFDRLPRLLLVRVHTDDGIVGLGETYDKVPGSLRRCMARWPRSCWATILATLSGVQNFSFDTILYHGFAGAELRALSAVEIALWDILGKSLGTPVYRLLGGAVRDRITTYNTCIGHGEYNDFERFHMATQAR